LYIVLELNAILFLPESLYRRAKAKIDRETGRMDPTELPYPTTRLGKAEGPSSLEKQITGSGNAKTKQTGLLRSDQETPGPNNPLAL
jgi:hypothetical protein